MKYEVYVINFIFFFFFFLSQQQEKGTQRSWAFWVITGTDDNFCKKRTGGF